MHKSKKTIIIDLLIICLLSFLPFLWLRGNQVILGHDAGLPLSPKEHFVDRLFTWTGRYGLGEDQSYALAGFFIHGFEALLDIGTLSLSNQQAIQFTTYFILFGLSMYLFTSTVFDKETVWPLGAALLYQFNPFILQAWFIVERTKFSLYIALPIILTLLFIVLYKQGNPYKFGLLGAFVLFVLNGGGFLPLFGATFISVLIFVLALFCFSDEKKKFIFNFLKFLLTASISSLFLHAYWLIPYFFYVKNYFALNVSQAGGIDGVINWLKAISANSSYINLFRLQGIQEWYVNAEHPYAYQYRKFLPTLLSFLAPTIFILALKFKKQTSAKIILTLVFVALVSMFFMAGSHPPFGFIYVLMIKHIPGFIAFRTPFYKFAPGFYVALAPLLAFVFTRILNYPFAQVIPRFLKKAFLIALVLLYSFPFFTSNFFQYTNDLSNKIQLPEYVIEYGEYANSEEFKYNRTLLFPGKVFNTGVSHYKWGYWSLATLHSLLDTNVYVTPPTLPTTLNDKLIYELYSAILENNPNWVRIAQNLEIDSILVERDFISFEFEGKTISGESISNALSNSSSVTKEKTFGEWELFSISRGNNISNMYIQVDNTSASYITSYLYDRLNLNPEVKIAQSKLNYDFMENIGSILYPVCSDCLLERRQTYFANSNSIFTPGSLPYKIIAPFVRYVKQPIGLQFDPRYTLQTLYIIQSNFNNEVEYKERKTSWLLYDQQLKLYEEHLTEALINYDPDVISNDRYVHFYNNLILQKTILSDQVHFIDQFEESEYFNNVTQKIEHMIELLEKNIEITKSIHENTYVFDIHEAGMYSIDLYLPSSNYQYFDDNIEVEINDVQYFAEKVDSEWVTLANIELAEGFHTVRFVDKQYNKEIDTSLTTYETMNLTGCYEIPLGQLETDTYNLSVNLDSTVGQIDVFYHIVREGEFKPVLPYWGIKQKISTNNPDFDYLFAASKNNLYIAYICDTTKQKEAPTKINSLVLDRLTKPVIVVSSVDLQDASVRSAVGTTHYQNNTKIDIATDSQINGIMTLPVAYSPLWATESGVELIPINGNLIGYPLDSTEDSPEDSLVYTQQRYVKIGWILTTIGVVSSLFAILVLHLHKKKK